MTTAAEVRAELNAWIDANWRDDLTVAEWWQRIADARWSGAMWPEPWGRGLAPDLAAAARATFSKRKVLGPPGGIGMALAVPTLVTHGSPEQQARFLPRIFNGQDAWCELFSEPGAGSDLASLQTKAERDGDEWIVNGQKVWTSGGQYADWAILVARTDANQPKHQGITYFAFPMRQAGVDVRPLREMTGRAMFNEVFIDNARVAHDCVIGGVNNGWAVANTTLTFERAGIGGGGAATAAIGGSIAGHLSQPVSAFLGRRTNLMGGGVGSGTYAQLLQLARERGRDDDPNIRQDLAELHERVELMKWSAARSKYGKGTSAATTGGEGNIGKVRMTQAIRHSRELAGEILGPDLTLVGDESATRGGLQEMTMFSPAPSIYGGTDEIQRNIIGERVLGLPKEPGPDRATPFKELLVGTQRPGRTEPPKEQ